MQSQASILQCNFKQNKCIVFRCYLRTADMKCKIENISINEQIDELKARIRQLFRMQIKSLQQIKLVINEVQLSNKSRLQQHLHDNVIIHIIHININNDQYLQGQGQQIRVLRVKIKQPRIDCPIEQIQIPQKCLILRLKQMILQYYKNNNQSHSISMLQSNDLYLVYCGRVMLNHNKLEDYAYQQRGVIYVVNGKQYVKQLTREQADRRIKQIRNISNQSTHNHNDNIKHKIKDDHNYDNNHNHYNNTNINIMNQNQQQQSTINIIQNIVDIDDQVYEAQYYNTNQFNQHSNQNPHPSSKSQTIIQRYNSTNSYQENQDNIQQSQQNTNKTENQVQQFNVIQAQLIKQEIHIIQNLNNNLQLAQEQTDINKLTAYLNQNQQNYKQTQQPHDYQLNKSQDYNQNKSPQHQQQYNTQQITQNYQQVNLLD